MIYNEEYKIKFYRDSRTGKEPALDFIKSLDFKIRLKINKYLDYLRDNSAYLDEPYSRHIEGKIRELRVDFSNNHYRIFYFCVIGKTVIILHAFLKKTEKTPINEIYKAKNRLIDCLDNLEIYEDKK
jgi:phage-related protein